MSPKITPNDLESTKFCKHLRELVEDCFSGLYSNNTVTK